MDWWFNDACRLDGSKQYACLNPHFDKDVGLKQKLQIGGNDPKTFAVQLSRSLVDVGAGFLGKLFRGLLFGIITSRLFAWTWTVRNCHHKIETLKVREC